MVGYAKAVLSFRKKLQERIDKCDQILQDCPKGWPSVIVGIELVKNELNGLMSQYFELTSSNTPQSQQEEHKE